MQTETSNIMDGEKETHVCSIDKDSQDTELVHEELSVQLSNNDTVDTKSSVQMQQIQQTNDENNVTSLSEMQCDDNSVIAAFTTKPEILADATNAENYGGNAVRETLEGKTLSEPNINEGNGPMTAKQLEDSQQDKSQCPADLALDSIMEVPVATEMMDMNAEIVGYNEKIVVEVEKKEGKTLSEPNVNEGSDHMTAKQLDDLQQDKLQCPADLALDSIMEVPVATEMMDMNAEIVGYNEKIVVEVEKKEGKTLSEPNVNEGSDHMTAKQLDDLQQDKLQSWFTLDSIMEKMMDRMLKSSATMKNCS